MWGNPGWALGDWRDGHEVAPTQILSGDSLSPHIGRQLGVALTKAPLWNLGLRVIIGFRVWGLGPVYFVSGGFFSTRTLNPKP